LADFKEVNFHLPPSLWDEPKAQVRYRNTPVRVKGIKPLENGRYKVFFEERVRGITPVRFVPSMKTTSYLQAG
jgi:tRNA-specific 2-thiouridylase